MKKRSLILGFAVFVGAALMFSGCEQETKTEYVTNTVTGEAQGFEPPDNAVEVGSEAVLVALLADESGVYNDIIYDDAPSAAVTVPSGKTLYLKADSAISLTADLTVNGKLVVYRSGGLTADAYLKGAGTLDVEEGVLSVTTAAGLFTGTTKLASATIKKGAELVNASTTPLASATDITNWVGYAGSGSLTISTAITAVSPSAATTAIGVLPEGKSVTLEVNPSTPATETSLTVPAGVELTTSDTLATLTSLTVNGTLDASSSATFAALTSLTVDGTLTAGSSATFAALTSLTVNGTFTAGSAATFGATAGVTITLSSKAEVAGLGAIAKLAANVTVPAGARFNIKAGITDFNGKTVTFKAGSSDIISDIDLVFSSYTSAGGFELSDNITLTEKQNIFIPENASFTVKAGKTITNAGTITLGEGASLVLTGGPATGSDTAAAGAKITGAGKIVAANTDLTGDWQAVGASGTVTITAADADESEITGATSVLTAGAGGVITQNAVASNNLTIAANTTIDLKGTIATPTAVGVIKLAESETANAGGKLTLSAATSVIKVGGETDAASALSAAGGDFVSTAATGKITVLSFSNVQVFDGGTTTGKVNTIKGASTAGTLQAFGGTSGAGAVEIKAGTATA